MDGIIMEDLDDQVIIYLLLEHIGCYNMEALTHLQNGDETAAVLVLMKALAILAAVAQHQSVVLEPQPPPADNQIPEELPNSLTLFNLPPIQSCDTPCFAVAIGNDGTFTLTQGFESAHRILATLTLYHAALAIHRGCSRVNGINRVEMTRSRDLYLACEMSLLEVPELKSVKHNLGASMCHLYAMFDCSAAA
jgi:hypothetical protein